MGPNDSCKMQSVRQGNSWKKAQIRRFRGPSRWHAGCKWQAPMKLRFLPAVVMVFLLALLASATGCKNTAHGAGEDIEKMGEKIQEKTR